MRFHLSNYAFAVYRSNKFKDHIIHHIYCYSSFIVGSTSVPSYMLQAPILPGAAGCTFFSYGVQLLILHLSISIAYTLTIYSSAQGVSGIFVQFFIDFLKYTLSQNTWKQSYRQALRNLNFKNYPHAETSDLNCETSS